MNALLVFLLQPAKNPPLRLAPIEGANLNEFDVIQHFYGKHQMTHTWNEYRVRPHVVEKVLAR